MKFKEAFKLMKEYNLGTSATLELEMWDLISEGWISL